MTRPAKTLLNDMTRCETAEKGGRAGSKREQAIRLYVIFSLHGIVFQGHLISSSHEPVLKPRVNEQMHLNRLGSE